MRCPKCVTDTLRLEPRLGDTKATEGGRRCERCGGFWIARAAVSALRDSGVLSALDAEPTTAIDSDRKNGVCPRGHGLMSRARVAIERAYFVERCTTCEWLWLDAGEWTRLSSEHLLDRLDDLWLPSWRARLHDEHATAALEDDLRKKLGDALFERLHTISMELVHHPHGDVALAYVRQLIHKHRPRSRTPRVGDASGP